MDCKIPCADPIKAAAELRNQLNQMASASQVLERATESEKGRTYLAMMNQSICRMLRIVGRMDLSHRLSDEKIRFSPTHLDLTFCLKEFSSRVQSILADIGVTFTLNCPPLLPVCADLEILQQLLLELISNLALAASEITLTVTLKGDTVYLTLSDAGPGNAKGRPSLPEALEAQEESSSLELARQLAKLHGGTLVISSGSDQSLSIAVSVPAGEAAFGTLKSPSSGWHHSGFDPVLVALSSLLPPRSFLPENLG